MGEITKTLRTAFGKEFYPKEEDDSKILDGQPLTLESGGSYLQSNVAIDRGPSLLQMGGVLQPDLNSPDDIITIDPQAERINPTRFPSTMRMGEASVDLDGSPTAYMPQDIGSDKLENGGGKLAIPYGYLPNETNYLGGYVSTTGWQRRRGPDTSQTSYVDARRVPYVAMPKSYFQGDNRGKYGDFVRVTNKITKKTIWAVVGDFRDSDKIELSGAAAKSLGIEFNKEKGTTKNAKNITIEAFRGSASGKWYE